MFRQFASLFFRSPPLARSDVRSEIDAADDSQFDNLPADDDSLIDRSRKLDFRNWGKPSRYRYLRLADVPAQICAEATDHWRVDAAGDEWVRVPDSDSIDVAVDDADAEMIAETKRLDDEIEATLDNFNARCERMIAERGDSFEPYQQWEPSCD